MITIESTLLACLCSCFPYVQLFSIRDANEAHGTTVRQLAERLRNLASEMCREPAARGGAACRLPLRIRLHAKTRENLFRSRREEIFQKNQRRLREDDKTQQNSAQKGWGD